MFLSTFVSLLFIAMRTEELTFRRLLDALADLSDPRPLLFNYAVEDQTRWIHWIPTLLWKPSPGLETNRPF